MSHFLQDDQQYVWHPFTQMQTEPIPLAVVRAKDSTLYTEDGKSYLDCNSSWWVNLHGHGNAHLKAALVNQFDAVDHVIFAGVTHSKAVELSRRILGYLPSNLSKVFFSDDGSTAVEVALKMVFQYWFNLNQPKHRILALDGAYHGDTFGAMSVGQRDYFNAPFEHFFFDVDFIPFPSLENETMCLQQAEALFKSGEFAGMIVEPLVQGSAGMRMYRPEFLEALFQLAKKHNVLIICDEIMTGWGRTGKLFAIDYIETCPDIVCVSKGLTAGILPLGLTIVTQQIYDAFLSPEKAKAMLHGHSYTGNPLACAVACANFDLIDQPEFQGNIDRISEQHAQFAATIKVHPKLSDVRQQGTILAVEVRIPEGNSYFSKMRDLAYAYFLERGLLIRPCGNVIFLNPPFCTTNKELTQMYAGISSFLDSL